MVRAHVEAGWLVQIEETEGLPQSCKSLSLFSFPVFMELNTEDPSSYYILVYA